MLALAVEHIDTLLEDWYPSLGTRFLHTSEGRMLVTRLVPCPRCLAAHAEKKETKSWQDWSFLPEHIRPPPPSGLSPSAVGGGGGRATPRVSQDSSTSDKDSGVGPDSPQETKVAVSNCPVVAEEAEEDAGDKVYSFLVEECILDAFQVGLELIL